jgi:hypothetical protein
MNNEQIKLCKTKPIFKMPKMLVTSAQITSYHSPVTIYHYAKQTQSKPILPATAGKIALPTLECRNRGSKAYGEQNRTVEGPVVFDVEG